MNKINLPTHVPDCSTELALRVIPLTPHSMCPDTAGLYYLSELKLTETALYGMLENIMGWHFEHGDLYKHEGYSDLRKKWEKVYRKKNKVNKNQSLSTVEYSYSPANKSKGTFSILSNYVSNIDIKGASNVACVDVQIAHRRRTDTIEVSRFSSKSRDMLKAGGDLKKLRAEGTGGTTVYYTKPVRREYVQGTCYEVLMRMDTALAENLVNVLGQGMASSPYIGHSDGWAEIEIVEHKKLAQ